MTEHPEHNPNDHEDPAVGATWFVGVAGVMILVVVLAGVTALFYRASDRELAVEFVSKPVPELERKVAEQAALLARPAQWVERTEGEETVRAFVIPIDRAMELTAQEYAAK